jgi:TatD DNase family protein
MSKKTSGIEDPRPPVPDPLPVAVVDGHTHLDIPATGRDGTRVDDLSIAELLRRAEAVGVPHSVQIGCDVASSRTTVDLVTEYPQLLGGVALHPNEVPRLAARGALAQAYRDIEECAKNPRIRVIGETGLDYFRTGSEGQKIQQDSFRWHIDLAKRLDLTLQIHDRDSHADVFRILAEEGPPRNTVFHCFSGDVEFSRLCIDAGYVLSFAGTVTFKNAQSLREALAVTPFDQLQVETDSPYLTPAPFRGRPNAAYLIPYTVRAMAQVKCCDVPTLCTQLQATATRLYGSWAMADPEFSLA